MPLIFEHHVLNAANTFGLPCVARAFCEPKSQKALLAVASDPALAGWPRCILGEGSNVLLPPRLEALVIRPRLRGRRVIRETRSHTLLEAKAGENWHEWVLWTLSHGLGGLENLALIPGSVGAAPVQNIGAYGLEMADYVDSVGVFDLRTRAFFRLHQEECAFSYRDSVFKRHPEWLIRDVRFVLPRRWTPRLDYPDLAARVGVTPPGSPQDVARAVMALRREKLPDPAVLGNAGSFFKNPVVTQTVFAGLASRFAALPHYPLPDGQVKLAAAWLIDQCGWRGQRLGPVGCHERQALVMVNHGGATLAAVAALAHRIKADVMARFGVMLEEEPTCFGRPLCEAQECAHAEHNAGDAQ